MSTPKGSTPIVPVLLDADPKSLFTESTRACRCSLSSGPLGVSRPEMRVPLRRNAAACCSASNAIPTAFRISRYISRPLKPSVLMSRKWSTSSCPSVRAGWPGGEYE